MPYRGFLVAAQIGFVYVHNHRFGYGLHFVVAEDAFHAFVYIGEGSVEVAGLHEVLCRGFFLVAFFIDLYERYFGQVVLVTCAVVEYFVDFGALDCRNRKFAGNKGLGFLDDAGLSFGKGQGVHYIWFGDAFHRAVLLHLVVAYFAFKPCSHIV